MTTQPTTAQLLDVIAQLQAQMAQLNTLQAETASIREEIKPTRKPIKVKMSPDDSFDPIVPGKVVKLHNPKTPYRELQARCGELGLKASGSKDVLLTRLGRHEAGTTTAEDYAKGKGKNSYAALKAQCEQYGLKKGGSAKKLAQRIADHEAGTAEQCEYKKANKGQGRIKKEKAAPRSAYGLDYRRAQRAVKWLKAAMPESALPAGLLKNAGWDNIEHNLTALLTTPWFAKLSTKQVKAMAKECVFDDAQFQAFVAEVGL